MPVWFFLSWLAPLMAYWGACAWLSGRLARERRRTGDARPVPDQFDPASSHRWAGLVLTESTRAYRPAVRAAFLIARTGLVLAPVAFIAAVVAAAGGMGGG